MCIRDRFREFHSQKREFSLMGGGVWENPTPSSEDKTGRGNERRYDSGALEP